MTRISRFAAVALTATVLTATGCGGDDAEGDRPPRLPVSGTVTYKEAPLADAQVTFNPEAPDGRAAFGRTDAEGHYELTTFEAGDGAVAGKYIVTIQKYDTPPVSTAEVPEEEYVPPEASNAPAPPPPKNLAPDKYRQMHTSDLRAVVSEGGDETFDFTLTD
ncbi:MAG: hypothetical protein WBC44_07390 [Planctomycetaceae bacterium]